MAMNLTDLLRVLSGDANLSARELHHFENRKKNKKLKVTQLHAGASENNISEVKAILKRGDNINAQSADGSTPLHLAVEENHLQMVKLLLENGAKPNLKRLEDFTPLHIALQEKREEISMLLLQNGANVLSADEQDWIPLHNVAWNGFSTKVLKELIARGSPINAKINDGRNALHLAAEQNFVEVVEILIEHGIKINALDQRKWRPLHCAAYDGCTEVVATLIKHGADVNVKTAKMTTPLHFAADNNHVGVVKLLLENGALVDDTDHTDYTALHFASEKGNLEVAKLLLKYGADINAKESRCFGGALHMAVQYGHLELTKLFIERNADVNTKMHFSVTPLLVAIQHSNVEMLRCLLESGAYYDSMNIVTNTTPQVMAKKHNKHSQAKLLLLVQIMYSAIEKGNISVVEDCMTHDVPVNCKSIKYKSALIYASQMGQADIVKLLLERGANVNITDEEELNALHYAAKCGHLPVALILLQNKIKFNSTSKHDKKTPLDFAKEEKHQEIVDLLEMLQNIFTDIQNGKLEVIDELKTIKTNNLPNFSAVINACNHDNKNLVDICFAGRSKEIANELLKLLK